MNVNKLELALRVAAIVQFGIAILNLTLVRIMKWSADLGRLPLLINEVFRVHVFFITATVAIFATLTWKFGNEMAAAGSPLAKWLAAAIGIFWGLRSIMQWTHYSSSHWRGLGGRTALHWLLFLGYATLGTVYLTAAFGGL